jgi:hypothetical protein
MSPCGERQWHIEALRSDRSDNSGDQGLEWFNVFRASAQVGTTNHGPGADPELVKPNRRERLNPAFRLGDIL